MKNLMFAVIILGFYSNLLLGSTVSVKLGSYKNRNALVQQIKKLEPSLQKSITVVKIQNLYKAFSIPYKDTNEAKKFLNGYKKVFSDAYITAYKGKISPTIKKLSDINITNKKESIKIVTPIYTQQKILSPKDLLKGKTFYVCPDRINSETEKILIRHQYFLDNTLTQKGLVGDIPPLTLYYSIYGNKIFFSRDGKANSLHYSQIEDDLFEYILVSNWVKGKKLYSMRYYKKESYAKAYLESIKF